MKKMGYIQLRNREEGENQELNRCSTFAEEGPAKKIGHVILYISLVLSNIIFIGLWLSSLHQKKYDQVSCVRPRLIYCKTVYNAEDEVQMADVHQRLQSKQLVMKRSASGETSMGPIPLRELHVLNWIKHGMI
jgi:hypothetical protein